MKRVLLSWSSGKDSAWTLHLLRRDPKIELCGLLTTLNEKFQRVAMHGTRRSVLEAQARAAGLPLWMVPLPWPCSNEAYEQGMAEVCERAVNERIGAVAFGDLFLADVRAYRETQLKPTGLEPLFPVWQFPTDELARAMIAAGFAPASPVWIPGSCPANSQAVSSTLRCCAISRPEPIPAASAASSTPAFTPVPCSRLP